MSGRLFLVTTPIGNLGDITERIAKTLNECDLILAEDTRVSIKLLNHLGIKKRLVSCHDFNEAERARLLVEIAEKDACCALLSDAGTPLIADPGHHIVQTAIELGMQVIPLPGPSAFLLALVASGLPCDRFVFEGFLPDKTGSQIERLKALLDEKRTIVFYVSPHKIVTTLKQIHDVFGERRACLARELTKLHEEFIRANLSELLEIAQSRQLRGEMVLCVAGNANVSQPRQSEASLRQAVNDSLKSGLRAKEIAEELAASSGWRKSDIYRLAIDEQEKESHK